MLRCQTSDTLNGWTNRIMNGTCRIVGGTALKGAVTPIPNKNSLMGALPLAVLRCPGVAYRNLPATTDVECFLEIYRRWGARIDCASEGSHLIDCTNTNSYRVDLDIGRKLRGAFSFVGPLLARFGVAEVPLPGGCRLGMRSIATHINTFRKVGVTVEQEDGYLRFRAPKKSRGEYTAWMQEASVTATLNVAMYAAARDADTTVIGASCEPHVGDVLEALTRMGAHITGIGTNVLHIKGVEELGATEFVASPDYVDIAGYLVAGAITGGELRIRGANLPRIMDGIIDWFKLFSVDIDRKSKDLIVTGHGQLRLKGNEFPMAGRDLPKLAVRPWPGFPVDILPVMITLASKTEGSILFQNWMYESGFDFVRELNYLGAEIYMSDPQKVIVMKPVVNFIGGEIVAPGIIQGTKAIFLASLADRVETVIHGTDILRRRYPNIFETYRRIGAEVSCTSSNSGHTGPPVNAVPPPAT